MIRLSLIAAAFVATGGCAEAACVSGPWDVRLSTEDTAAKTYRFPDVINTTGQKLTGVFFVTVDGQEFAKGKDGFSPAITVKPINIANNASPLFLNPDNPVVTFPGIAFAITVDADQKSPPHPKGTWTLCSSQF
jgi:hypothetical protein